jgi:hypothetical protein
VVVPWDLDISFQGFDFLVIRPKWNVQGTGPCACDGFGYLACSCDPLLRHWSTWSADYEKAVDAFIAGPLSESRVNAKLESWSSQIATAVAESVGTNGTPTVRSLGKWRANAPKLRHLAAREPRLQILNTTCTRPQG